jgi:hypothetical protein
VKFTQVLRTWFSTEGIGVSRRLALANIVTIGWFLQKLLIWFSGEGIGISFMLVHVKIVTCWCL